MAVTAPKYMREKWVLSIDPGGKGGDTGIVLLGYTPETRPVLVDSWAVKDELRGFRDWYDWFIGEAYGPEYAHTVIVERFVHFKAVQIETTPILIEGAVRFIWPNAVLSPASGKNTAVPDEAMKRLGLYIAGDHHRDRNEACRHALRWLKNQKHVPTLKAFG